MRLPAHASVEQHDRILLDDLVAAGVTRAYIQQVGPDHAEAYRFLREEVLGRRTSGTAGAPSGR